MPEASDTAPSGPVPDHSGPGDSGPADSGPGDSGPGDSVASGTVHWVGAGLSTGSGLTAVCDTAARVLVWHRSVERAEQVLAAHGLTGRAEGRAYDPATFGASVGAGDVVVSMLPATAHPDLLRVCVGRGAHFACTSYVSDAIVDLVPAAVEAGVAVLVEAGLDPGIDHLFAHDLVDRAVAELGPGPARARFTSYCGGVPSVPNDFRYRFSWAPFGVLNALRSPARYIADGAVTTVARPWEAVESTSVDGEEFEVYPNRDSVPFVEQYHLPAEWTSETFVRGTLRLGGWRAAWTEVFDTLVSGDDETVRALAADLARRYPTTDDDRDRVVLVVTLEVEHSDGRTWSGRHLLDLTGTAAESAMARCVSQPLAFGVAEILAGRLPAGLTRCAESGTAARRWLTYLRGLDIVS